MVLDYYQLDYHLPAAQTPVSMDDAARYVREGPSGTRTDDLQQDLVTAEAALDPAIPLTDGWQQTDSAHWFATLQAELTHQLPMILFIPNGRNLGWKFNWGHYIVVSGSTDDGGIIYHDPRDGATHSKSGVDFAAAWGTPFNDPNGTWIYKYLEILPPGVTSPVPTSTSLAGAGSTPVPPAADLTGWWDFDIQGQNSPGSGIVRLAQAGATLSGSFSLEYPCQCGATTDSPITGTVTGADVMMDTTQKNSSAGENPFNFNGSFHFQGKIDDSSGLNGSVTVVDSATGQRTTYTWYGTKRP
jgi:hypothetical protein